MPWVRLEDTFYDHPKVLTVGLAASGLHVLAICYASAKLTDGFVSERVMVTLHGTPRLAARLVAAGLWELVEGGWRIHDFLDYNPSRAATQAHRQKVSEERAKAGRAGGIASAIAKQRASKPAASVKQPVKQTSSPVPSRTQPVPIKGSHTVNTRRAQPPREPLLTKAQLDEWKSFGPKWEDFKAAWLGRGFMYPPSGSPEDDDGSQRGLLWSILDSRPSSLPTWIREAPGKSTNEVIGHVIRRWHDIRDAAEATDPVIVARGPNRREAPERLGSIIERLPVQAKSA